MKIARALALCLSVSGFALCLSGCGGDSAPGKGPTEESQKAMQDDMMKMNQMLPKNPDEKKTP